MRRGNYEFPSQFMRTLLRGLSALDVPRLFVNSPKDAEEFIRTYGYDIKDPEDQELVWSIYEQALHILQNYLLHTGEKIPEVVGSRAKLQDITRLLVYASTTEHEKNPIQLWSCAILRVMHCVAHVESDLFSSYTAQIQDQILKPFQVHVIEEKGGQVLLGSQERSDQIALEKFEVKAFKEKHSMVIKALSKAESVAIDQFDKIGVRFVTRTVFDAFRVVRYLHNENVFSFPNIVPNQARNTLFPDNLFLELMSEYRKANKVFDPDSADQELQGLLAMEQGRAEYKEKENPFTDPNYRALKFICRQMIRINPHVRFFYPYEIQVMDYKTYLGNLTGPAAHAEYKKRQRKAARDRILGEIVPVLPRPEKEE